MRGQPRADRPRTIQLPRNVRGPADEPGARRGPRERAQRPLVLLPFVEQHAVYNVCNFDLENYQVANHTAVRTRLEIFLVLITAKSQTSRPPRCVSRTVAHYLPNPITAPIGRRPSLVERGRGWLPQNASSKLASAALGPRLRQRARDLLGRNDDRSNHRRRSEGTDGRPNARNVRLRTSRMVRPSPWQWSRGAIALAGPSAAGVEASSTFSPLRHTKVTTRSPARFTVDQPTRTGRTPCSAMARCATWRKTGPGSLVRPDHPRRR